MLSPTALALIFSVIAGIMNGSFALPTKHIKIWDFEHIWFNYSVWAFLILPWLSIFLLDSTIFSVYLNLPVHLLLVILIGGFLFGFGQVCFALGLRSIGLGLGFVITIGLGTGLGSLVPLLQLDWRWIGSPAGIITLVGVFCILLSLCLSYSAGQLRAEESQSQKKQVTKRATYILGVSFAIIAGLFSAGQNYVFATTQQIHNLATAAGADSLTSSIIIWPPFLACSFIPYACYMLFLHKKNRSFHYYQSVHSIKNLFLSVVMACFWFGSLAIYSKASLLLGYLGPVIAWPLFMVLIILTSNFWSWRHEEWNGCSVAVKKRMHYAIAISIAAVLILTLSASLTLSIS